MSNVRLKGWVQPSTKCLDGEKVSFDLKGRKILHGSSIVKCRNFENIFNTKPRTALSFYCWESLENILLDIVYFCKNHILTQFYEKLRVGLDVRPPLRRLVKTRHHWSDYRVEPTLEPTIRIRNTSEKKFCLINQLKVWWSFQGFSF